MVIFADCFKYLRETRKSNIKVMRINDLMNRKGLPYEAPSITLLDIMSEGMLCQSLDRPDNGYDNDYDLGEI